MQNLYIIEIFYIFKDTNVFCHVNISNLSCAMIVQSLNFQSFSTGLWTVVETHEEESLSGVWQRTHQITCNVPKHLFLGSAYL